MKNLVITTVGEKHCAASWLDGGGYDVVLIDYTRDTVFKYPGIADYIMEHDLWGYDYYWMPDEDIELSCGGINEMFYLMDGGGIDLAQPSILEAPDSFPSWKRFVHREGPDVVPTDFVEIMCPAFSSEGLRICMQTFRKSMTGWGQDLVWSKLLGEKGMRVAIINAVVAKHTRGVGAGGLYGEVKKLGIYPSQERKRLMREYGITEHSILK
jgi:hypothetical protein